MIRPLQEVLDAAYADFERDANEGRRFGSIEMALRWNRLLLDLLERDQLITDLNFGRGYREGQAAGWEAGTAWDQERERKLAELAAIVATQATEIATLRGMREPSGTVPSAEDATSGEELDALIRLRTDTTH